ncbi:siphovirus Gp157 family protein, partial [Escherichia coli]|uniref:siphovirus Gp157 family protein n=1 Tax=Escherichia coli TaxID=562 RepID=UPI001F0DB3B4
MLPSEILIWQPEFTDKTLSRKPGAVHQVTIRKPSETVEIIDSSALPSEYVEFETTIKADKLAIKHQLKAGINIPGAQLKVGKPSLLIK